MRVGFHASHEQFAPSDMLKYTIAAERAGAGGARFVGELPGVS